MSILSPAAKCADREYDVAISFLVVDENIAASIKGGLSGLNVFFLPTQSRRPNWYEWNRNDARSIFERPSKCYSVS
jgi:hypothetical protein